MRERDWVSKRTWVWKYLLVDVLVVFNGWAFGVVTRGGWSRGETPEQTTGVLLLTINELLHKTLSGVHNKEHTHTQTWYTVMHGFLLKKSICLKIKEVSTTVSWHLNILMHIQPQNMPVEYFAAGAWQMGCRGGFLGEWRTQLCANQQLNNKIDYEVHCVGYSIIAATTCSPCYKLHFLQNIVF